MTATSTAATASARYGTASAVAAAERAGARAAERGPAAPGEVAEAVGEGGVEVAALGAVAEHRHGRRPQQAEAAEPDDHGRAHGDRCAHQRQDGEPARRRGSARGGPAPARRGGRPCGPARGDSADSRTTATRNTAAMAAAPAPRSSRRSGTSTLTAPNTADGIAISRMPVRARRSPEQRGAARQRRRTVGSGSRRQRGDQRERAATTKAANTTLAADHVGGRAERPGRRARRRWRRRSPSPSPRRGARAARPRRPRPARPPTPRGADALQRRARAISSSAAVGDREREAGDARCVASAKSTVRRGPMRAASQPAGRLESTSVPSG